MTTDAKDGYIPEITTGWRIRIARERAHMEQSDLAAAADISRNTISNYEQDATTRMKPLYLKQIALATGVNPHWLATGKGPGPTDRDGVTPPLVRGRSQIAQHAHAAAA